MSNQISEWLFEAMPFFVALSSIILIIVHSQLEKANKYLRQITFQNHLKLGKPPRDWEDVGRP